MATGRKPNTEDIGFDKAGVETEKGFIKTNAYLQTANTKIYTAEE